MNTPSRDLPQAEHWKPVDPRLSAILGALQEEALGEVPTLMSSLDSVGLLEIEKANAVAFAGAAPHVDEAFPRWFVMMTLEVPGPTLLHTADLDAPPSDIDGLVPDLSIPLEVGELCLFDAHKVHWVDRPEGAQCDDEMANPSFTKWLATEFRDTMSVMIGTESEERPTREQAEQMLVEFLQKMTPKCWDRAGLNEQPAPAARSMRSRRP